MGAQSDDTDEGQDSEVEQLRKFNKPKDEPEKKKIVVPPGGLMKAIIRPGHGEATPRKDDQVTFHYTTRTTDGVVVQSSQSDLGGKGVPVRLVLGKSKLIKAWEECLPTMLRGEVAMFKVIPDLHYGDPECPVSVPEEFPRNDVLMFEIHMLYFRKVKVVTDDCKVVKQILKEGEGFETAREPYEIKVWITGRIADGVTFFSVNNGEPFEFAFGKGQVPEGLEKAVGTMTKAEKATIFMSQPYITAASAIPELPLNEEELEFDVEVVQIVQVRDMLGDGQVIKRRIRDGLGEFPMDCPLHDSLLRIHYKGLLPGDDGRIFLDTRIDNGGQPVEFGSGEGRVPEGLEMSVKLMLPGELALVTSSSRYAYDSFPRPETVPVGATVQWEVELLGFTKLKDWTGLTFQEIMEEANKIKETGNRLFKEGKFELAKVKYEMIIREFNHVNPQNDEEGEEFLQARNTLHLNIAACQLKLEDTVKSIETCNKVLEGNPFHIKALYRRGNAYMQSGDFDEARADFEKMLKIDQSSSIDAQAALRKLRQKEQDAARKARKQFKGLFDKKPGEISEGREEKYDTPENASVDKNTAEETLEEEILKEGYQSRFRKKIQSVWLLGKNMGRHLPLKKCVIL